VAAVLGLKDFYPGFTGGEHSHSYANTPAAIRPEAPGHLARRSQKEKGFSEDEKRKGIVIAA
jgi:hypothetical protein